MKSLIRNIFRITTTRDLVAQENRIAHPAIWQSDPDIECHYLQVRSPVTRGPSKSTIGIKTH